MPEAYTLRPYTPDGAPAVARLINAAAPTLGVPRAVVDGVGNVRLARYIPPQSEHIIAIDERGAIAGYAYLTERDHPAVREVGGATDLAPLAGAGIRSVLQTNLFEAEQTAIALFEQAGFARVREWSHLMLELERPPVTIAPPAPLVIRPMDLDADWEIVGPALDEGYADHWGVIVPPADQEPEAAATEPAADAAEPEAEAPTDDSYSNAPGHCFLVLDGPVVAGGILCNARLVERDDAGRIGSVFVRPAYRRRGLGRALMLAAFDSFWQRGIRRIILGTDAASTTGAAHLYASLGLRRYRREFLYEREIRPGNEIRRMVASDLVFGGPPRVAIRSSSVSA